MYATGFLFSLSSAIPTYISSTFISQFTSDKLVGIIYAASSLLAIATFVEIPGILRRFGTFKATLALLVLEILSIIGLSLGYGASSIISAFILNFVTISLINFTLDIFLEEFSSNAKTGKIRGTYLTIANTAWLISPTIASWVLGDGSFANVYMLSGFLLLPVIALILLNLGNVKEPIQNRVPFWKSFAEVWADRNIKGILILQFLMQFFYAWMIIYTPIYLLNTVGFDWQTIGFIFSVMLLPFVLLEGFLGTLADKYGEKSFLSIGFLIMGVFTGLIPFVTDHNVVVWAALLFMTRVGAAIVEVMTDTYFFKMVDASKTNIIGFFRTARPLAYVVSPIVATILFFAFDIRGLFIFLGMFMMYGLRYSLSIKDIR